MCRRLGPNVSHFEEPYAIAEKSDNPRTCADEEQSFGRNAEARRPECAWRFAAGERRVSTGEKLHTGDCLRLTADRVLAFAYVQPPSYTDG